MIPPLEEMCVDIDSNLDKVIEILGINSQGIDFVIEKENYFLGVITDGDIRKGYQKGYNLNTHLVDIYNKKAISLPVNTYK